MSAPPVRGPHDVPNLRLYLLDRWRVGGVYETTARIMRLGWVAQGQMHGWREREESDWNRGHLGDPDLTLWWVSAEMVEEVTHVAAELPHDVQPLDVPGLVAEDEVSTRGLVVLEKPIMGLDAHHDKQIRVDAFTYGGTRLPPIHGQGWRMATSVSAYRHVNYDEGLDEDGLEASVPVLEAEKRVHGGHSGATQLERRPGSETLQLHGEEWLPLGRSDWPLAWELAKPVDPSVSPQQHQSMMEDRRWLAALHLVAADNRVATVRRVQPAEKHLRRPSERRKLDPTVRVVYLRQLDEEKVVVGRTAGGRKPPRAHIVRSHPRWQACGPHHQDHKLILIPRHSRGHGGAPTEGPPTVKAIVKG